MNSGLRKLNHLTLRKKKWCNLNDEKAEVALIDEDQHKLGNLIEVLENQTVVVIHSDNLIELLEKVVLEEDLTEEDLGMAQEEALIEEEILVVDHEMAVLHEEIINLEDNQARLGMVEVDLAVPEDHITKGDKALFLDDIFFVT